MLGATGAAFRRLFTGPSGLALAAAALLLRASAPAFLGRRLFLRKDF
jgi:hypothetical protein